MDCVRFSSIDSAIKSDATTFLTINKNNPNWEEVYSKVKTLMDVTYTLSPYNNSFNASSICKCQINFVNYNLNEFNYYYKSEKNKIEFNEYKELLDVDTKELYWL